MSFTGGRRLFEVYRIKGHGRAQHAFEKLLKAMKQSNLEEVQKLFKTFQRWKSEILKYFENNYTNAFTVPVSLEELAEMIDGRGYGRKIFFSSCDTLNVSKKRISQFMIDADIRRVAGYESAISIKSATKSDREILTDFLRNWRLLRREGMMAPVKRRLKPM